MARLVATLALAGLFAASAHAAAAQSFPVPPAEIQQKLAGQGLDVGIADGVWGAKSREALAEFQRRLGLPATGEPDAGTISILMGMPAGESATLRPQARVAQSSAPPIPLRRPAPPTPDPVPEPAIEPMPAEPAIPQLSSPGSTPEPADQPREALLPPVPQGGPILALPGAATPQPARGTVISNGTVAVTMPPARPAQPGPSALLPPVPPAAEPVPAAEAPAALAQETPAIVPEAVPSPPEAADPPRGSAAALRDFGASNLDLLVSAFATLGYLFFALVGGLAALLRRRRRDFDDGYDEADDELRYAPVAAAPRRSARAEPLMAAAVIPRDEPRLDTGPSAIDPFADDEPDFDRAPAAPPRRVRSEEDLYWDNLAQGFEEPASYDPAPPGRRSAPVPAAEAFEVSPKVDGAALFEAVADALGDEAPAPPRPNLDFAWQGRPAPSLGTPSPSRPRSEGRKFRQWSRTRP